MSLAAPVLERKVNSEEQSEIKREVLSAPVMSEEEMHNSRISENYAKLINPETKLKDIINEPVYEKPATAERAFSSASREIIIQKPYLVENARADADIFRADSAINRRILQQTEVVAEEVSDEENEDLRPTPATIQYRTVGVQKTTEEGKITNSAATRKARLSKRDKIIIAAVVTVIVALFVLIVVNSAIISGINSDISQLQTALPTAAENYANALAEKEAYLNEANLYQVVSEFATENGMILR